MKCLEDSCGDNKIESFPPGHYYTPKTGFVRYFNPEWFDFRKAIHPLDLKLLQKTMIASVHKRLMSDAPIGVLLSGGLDSSLVSSIASREMKRRGMAVHSFSIGVDHNSPDVVAARKVAKFIGTTHHEFYFSIEVCVSSIRNNKIHKYVLRKVSRTCVSLFGILSLMMSHPFVLLLQCTSSPKKSGNWESKLFFLEKELMKSSVDISTSTMPHPMRTFKRKPSIVFFISTHLIVFVLTSLRWLTQSKFVFHSWIKHLLRLQSVWTLHLSAHKNLKMGETARSLFSDQLSTRTNTHICLMRFCGDKKNSSPTELDTAGLTLSWSTVLLKLPTRNSLKPLSFSHTILHTVRKHSTWERSSTSSSHLSKRLSLSENGFQNGKRTKIHQVCWTIYSLSI